jgi:hypothetical protein
MRVWGQRGFYLRDAREAIYAPKMRRSTLGLASLTLCTSLVACGDDDPAETLTTAPTSAPTTITTASMTAATTSGTPETDGTTGPTSGATPATTGETDTDPTGEPTTAVDPTTGPDGCMCAVGEYCVANECMPGCDADEDCNAPAKCDLGDNTCKGCLEDANCGLGTVCLDGTCVPGCSDAQPCDGGLACCAGGCFDLLTDPAHCGGCDVPCPVPANAAASCIAGACGLGDCTAGFTNCDGDAGNGCEVSGDCQCTPGEQTACYTGTQGTQDVGVCKSGVQTCNAQGTGFGECVGEVVPGPTDICGNKLDDDCDATVDEDPDADKDGWTVCGGDCCDAIGPDCLNPELVNPGAFDVMGNMVDDDCDSNKDNVLPACDAGLPSGSADPLEYAKAIDLCQFTVENPPQKDKKWGVISGLFSRSNGAGNPAGVARSIRPGFGANVTPKANATLAVLSTGNAADSNDQNPAFAAFQGGKDLGTDAAVPNDWLTLNGNNFPNVAGCPEPQGGNTGNDTIQLKLRIRVPTNALSFSTKIYFFSSEYPEWVCSAFNDFFVTLVDSTGAGNPADKNIAVYKDAQNKLFPVGVNLVKTANGLFTQCKNGPTGCGGGAVAGNYNGCVGNTELVGTGFDPLNPAPQFQGDPGYCGASNQVGGGTGWLKMAGNVKPGETMELRFTIWDTGDGFYDSVVLLDDFQWSVQASQPGVQPG